MKLASLIIMVLLAGLLLLPGAPAARACGYWHDDAGMFSRPLEEPALAMPAPSFQRELIRLLHLPPVPVMRAGNKPTSAPRQLDLDVRELEAVLNVSAATTNSQARTLVAGYRAMRQSMDLARQAQKPFNAAPFQGLMTTLPWEFVLYTQGAVAWQNDDTTRAVEAWRTLLSLPQTERKYRSTWAAFMIGRALEEDTPDAAITAFEECRRLAAAGFTDSLNLAAASLGWQARVELHTGKTREAIGHYVAQARARGGVLDVQSLKLACAAIAGKGGEIPAPYALDPVCRAVLSAYFLAIDAGGEGDAGTRWCRAIAAAGGAVAPEEAEALAWLAYRRGEMALARQWLGRVPSPGGIGRWLRAKLMLRDGQLTQAIAELEALRKFFSPDEIWASPGDFVYEYLTEDTVPYRGVCRELAALYAGQEKYLQALDAAIASGRWEDAAYLAERVVTSDELAAYLDANQGSPTLKAPADYPILTPMARKLDHLLARRLLREGQFDRARRYFERGAPELRAKVDAYIRAMKFAVEPSLSDRARAIALFEAGLAARPGMPLLGTEMAPDWAISYGNFTDADPAEYRLTGFNPEDASAGRQPPPPPASPLALLLAPKPAEQARLRASAPAPYLRYHYRYQAADLMWAGAQLLPDNDPLLPRMLWQGSRFINDRAPRTAYKFYRALVLHCPALPAGRRAARLGVMPADAPEIPTTATRFTSSIVRVAPGGNDRNDGSSWPSAKRTIQAAIAEAALTSGSVWVAAGVYRESIHLIDGVAVYGGFTGRETSLRERRISSDAQSVIDANLVAGSGGPPVISRPGASRQPPILPAAGRPAEHAVVLENLGRAVLDGFTIRGGDARGAGDGQNGGGIFARNLGPGVTISRCLVAGNRASSRGAGVYLENASPLLTSCTITGNLSADSGGGLALAKGARPRLAACVIAANGANYGRGGGLYAENAAFELASSWLSGNWSGSDNGGGACLLKSSAALANCFITGNSAGHAGGAAYADAGSSLTLAACTVVENKAASGGGGVFYGLDAAGTLENCLFAKNQGYAVEETRHDPQEYHGQRRHAALARVSHCFFSANSPAHYRIYADGSQEFVKKTAAVFKTGRAIDSRVPGGGNRGGDPRFAIKSAARKGKWTDKPVYHRLSNTTTLYDKDADFSALPARLMLLRPDKHRRSVALIMSVRGRNTLEVLGDWTGLTARGRQYRLLDYHLQDGSGALGGGLPLSHLPTDIDGNPRRGRIDIGAAQAPAGFKAAPDHTPPVSKAGRLPEISTGSTLSIRFTCRDEESAVRQVQLFYRRNAAAWQPAATLALTTASQTGAGAIRFDALQFGDGVYEFYTIATDSAGNTEPPPKQPDARTRLGPPPALPPKPSPNAPPGK